MKAVGSSAWAGTWKHGSGTISTESDTFKERPFSYASRFEGTPGASPEELFAAAFAGCFNQALANNFGMLEYEAQHINTTVVVELGIQSDGRPGIVDISISCSCKVSGISEDNFNYCIEQARTHCAIARITKIGARPTATLL